MIIYLNDKKTELNTDYAQPISSVLDLLALSEKGIALAVNGEVINRSHWLTYDINDRDHIDIFSVVAGG